MFETTPPPNRPLGTPLQGARRERADTATQEYQHACQLSHINSERNLHLQEDKLGYAHTEEKAVNMWCRDGVCSGNVLFVCVADRAGKGGKVL